MHVTDWKENFISKMITRGRNYWRAGAVKDLHCTQEKIAADVEGTRLYRVEITLAGDAVATLSCTCPFAKEGANCKHMAAVLFAATHLPESELPAPEWAEQPVRRNASGFSSSAAEKGRSTPKSADAVQGKCTCPCG